MENSRIPIEICERIIDFLEDVLVLGDDPAKIARTWALTCSNWLPRSCYHIYDTVRLTTREQCVCFLKMVAKYPERAGWVRTLCIDSKEYVPFFKLLAPQFFMNCSRLDLIVDWGQYPPYYVDNVLVPLLKGCANITSIHMDTGAPLHTITFSEFLHIIRSMPWLQRLKVTGAAPSLLTLHNLNLRLLEQPICGGLDRLLLHHQSWCSLNMPISSMFGLSIHKLAIGLNHKGSLTDTMSQYLSSLRFLTELEIGICVTEDLTDAEFILSALSFVQSPPLKSLKFILVPFLHGEFWAHGRGQTAMLDLLFGDTHAWHKALKPFTRLDLLHFVLYDYHVDTDTANKCWTDQIRSRLSDTKFTIKIEVISWKEQHTNWQHLWAPAADLPSISKRSEKEAADATQNVKNASEGNDTGKALP
ncbi:hypothetical protein C8Q78DRAFT_751326 [Trametes maxima]|nr:hypothetical protein C8Q78DRAFT_751326 [Trametes maxima]